MHERKEKMMELADGFVALPGGFGTMEELFEVLTWSQLGIHQKPCALLNSRGFFDPLLSFLENLVSQGFLKPEHRDLIQIAGSPEEILPALEAYQPLQFDKWIDQKPAN